MNHSSQAYFRHGPNLALFRHMNSMQSFWNEHWLSSNLVSVLHESRKGRLGEYEKMFTKYLPKKGLILEAGCGTGKIVSALQSRGYTIEGIDYAEETLKAAQAIDPTLNLRVGNIGAIDRPDHYYQGYISIGVLEHNFDGPDLGIKEAYRVLDNGGIALISVPYLNWPRKITWEKSREEKEPRLSDGLTFYQDHYNVDVFSSYLARNGFTILEKYPYLLFGGIIRDWSLGRWLQKHKFFSYSLQKLVKYACANAPNGIRNSLSHMMMFACIKK